MVRAMLMTVLVVVMATLAFTLPQQNRGGFNSFGGGGFGGGGYSSGGCRYWCRTPSRQYYCCENGNGNNGPTYPIVKPGQCPPVRPQCPPVRGFAGRPQQCSSDSSCSGSQKCCYDTCLGHHTCKQPGYGFF